MTELSSTDKLVMVLAKMHDDGMEQFHEAALTVEAWKMFPETFGLGDYWKTYPNHKRVCNTYLTGKDSRTGPIGKGYMVRTRKNHYAMTSACLTRAQELDGEREFAIDDLSILRKEDADRLLRALSSAELHHLRVHGEVSPDWNSAVSFLEIETPSFRGMTETKSRSIKKQNHASISNWKSSLQEKLDSGAEVFRITGQGGSAGKDTYSRQQIILICQTFNAIMEKWDRHLRRLGIADNIDTIDILEVVE